MREKLKNAKGFTLIEMLIVVAIIAILIAISIPMVNSSLDSARRATDAANERAAKALGVIKYLSENITAETTYNYDAVSGELKANTATVSGYGKCSDHKGDYLTVTVGTDGTVTVKWNGSDTLDGSAMITEPTTAP